jgi:D-inositol-3-phosphate glycosyltransferase
MNVYVRQLSSALARAGVDCEVYTRSWRRGLPSDVDVEPGLRVHHVPAGPRAPMDKEDLPGVIDAFTEGVLDRLSGVSRPDLLHANYWLSGVSGHAIKHELDLPLVSTFHTLARVKAEATSEAEEAARAKAEAVVVGCSDAILASSAVEAAQLERLYDADPDRIEIVPPGVDHELFCPGDRERARAELGLGVGDGPMVLFVGRIQPLKGAAVAVRALRGLQSHRASLVIVGGPSGPSGAAELRRVKELVAADGLVDQVRFVRPQPHSRLPAFYRTADVCLVPSRSESFGLVALEAAACGTPVVASAVGGLTTLVVPDETGFLVEGRDPAAYAERLDAILGDPELAAALGKAAWVHSQRYSWSIAAARLRRLYADLTDRRPVECR